MTSSKHAPVGTKVRVVTEGFEDHSHLLRVGDEGVVRSHTLGFAEVKVEGKDSQVLEREDYEEIK